MSLGNPAVMIARDGGGVVIEQAPIPTAGPGGALIQTRCSLISSGTELSVVWPEPGTTWYGLSTQLRETRRPLGYSNVGTVIDVGPDVDRAWIGRRVASASPHAAIVQNSLLPTADRRTGGIVPLPDEVSDEEGTFVSLAVTAMRGLRCADLVWGETVAVVGLGLLGQLTARFSLFAGARQVIGVSLSERRLAWLPEDPRVRSCTGGVAAVKDRLRDGALESPPDVVFDVTGNPDSIRDSCDLVRPQGRVVLLSSPRGRTEMDFNDLCSARSISIVGAHVGSHPLEGSSGDPWTRARHAELFMELVASRKLAVADLITHRVEPDAARDVYELLTRRAEGGLGVVFQWPPR